MTPLIPREHRFGGEWTVEKLERVRKYLRAYTTIFRGNERARHLRTTYIDAFAGSGHRAPSAAVSEESSWLLDVEDDPETRAFKKGSAAIALEVDPDFDRYVFIDTNAERVEELEALRSEHPDKTSRVLIVRDDANVALQRIIDETDWQRNRAVVFLDPYGMSIEWQTIQALGATAAVDLWVLYPLGQAINRLLMRGQIPTGSWADKLTRCLGTDGWRSEFYEPSSQLDLLGGTSGVEKTATFDSIARFIEQRLATCFAAVSPDSLRLYNSRNNPLFLLCFAVANPNKTELTLRIANHILKGP